MVHLFQFSVKIFMTKKKQTIWTLNTPSSIFYYCFHSHKSILVKHFNILSPMWRLVMRWRTVMRRRSMMMWRSVMRRRSMMMRRLVMRWRTVMSRRSVTRRRSLLNYNCCWLRCRTMIMCWSMMWRSGMTMMVSVWWLLNVFKYCKYSKCLNSISIITATYAHFTVWQNKYFLLELVWLKSTITMDWQCNCFMNLFYYVELQSNFLR